MESVSIPRSSMDRLCLLRIVTMIPIVTIRRCLTSGIRRSAIERNAGVSCVETVRDSLFWAVFIWSDRGGRFSRNDLPSLWWPDVIIIICGRHRPVTPIPWIAQIRKVHLSFSFYSCSWLVAYHSNSVLSSWWRRCHVKTRTCHVTLTIEVSKMTIQVTGWLCVSAADAIGIVGWRNFVRTFTEGLFLLRKRKWRWCTASFHSYLKKSMFQKHVHFAKKISIQGGH